MTKNIRVTDSNGNKLGFTYPKRAKGLIKNGRAQYVDDCTIRLSKLPPDELSEVKKMNYIYLNPRDWSEKNYVELTFIDGFEGKLEEILQIGGWNTSCIAESRHYLLDAETEYNIVFWLNGGENDTSTEICDLMICFNIQNGYKNRYKLNRNYIKPILHHAGWELYSIGFITPKDENSIDVSFCFKTKAAPMAIKSAKEIEYYSSWKDEPDEFASLRPQRHNLVFEDGWPSLHMYGGDKYSTEILRQKVNSKKEEKTKSTTSLEKHDLQVNLSRGSSFNSIDDLEDEIDDIKCSYEDIIDNMDSIFSDFEELKDRSIPYTDLASEVDKVGNQLKSIRFELTKITIEAYENWLSDVSNEMEGMMLSATLDNASSILAENEAALDDIECRIEELNDMIDNLEDQDD